MLDFCILLFLFVKTGKKFQSACVVFYMNNMLFLRKYGDMSMHASCRFDVKMVEMQAVFLSWKSGKEIPVCMLILD